MRSENDSGFPHNAIQYCLEGVGLGIMRMEQEAGRNRVRVIEFGPTPARMINNPLYYRNAVPGSSE
jgi:hypothetical protein